MARYRNCTLELTQSTTLRKLGSEKGPLCVWVTFVKTEKNKNNLLPNYSSGHLAGMVWLPYSCVTTPQSHLYGLYDFVAYHLMSESHLVVSKFLSWTCCTGGILSRCHAGIHWGAESDLFFHKCLQKQLGFIHLWPCKCLLYYTVLKCNTGPVLEIHICRLLDPSYRRIVNSRWK